jgi:ATP-dependent DNA helicase RecQ
MIEFCQLQSCRRQFLLEYFGEKWGEQQCSGCDICLTEKEEFDATEITQKILSAVIRTGERLGMGHISSVLRGSKAERVRDLGHDKLFVHGIARDATEPELKHVIGILLTRGLLTKNGQEYLTLAVTQAGRTFLKNRDTLVLEKPKRSTAPEAPRNGASLEYDQTLFEELRALRKRIADRRGVPPFVIFGNVTLRQMATYFPQRNESLSRISGVGTAKLDQFGPEFLAVIRRYARENSLSERAIPSSRKERNRAPRRGGSTLEETRELFLKNLSIKETADRRGLTEGTVINHLERLVMAGEELNLDRLMPPPERFSKIRAAFQEADSQFLAPVHDLLGEGFSYEEIRLVRLCLHQG